VRCAARAAPKGASKAACAALVAPSKCSSLPAVGSLVQRRMLQLQAGCGVVGDCDVVCFVVAPAVRSTMVAAC
jgi:hypothetical protein